jgi:hypothetical protein
MGQRGLSNPHRTLEGRGGKLPTQQMVKGGSQAIKIGVWSKLSLRNKLFGGSVGGGGNHFGKPGGSLDAIAAGVAKVNDHRAIFGSEHDVVGFEIAVQHPRRMHLLERP